MNENKSTVKNIFYPLIVFIIFFVVTVLVSSCSLVSNRVVVSYETLDHLVFSNREGTQLITFADDEVVQQKESVYSTWTYTIEGKKLQLVNDAQELKTIFVFSKTKMLDESERVYLYEVEL